MSNTPLISILTPTYKRDPAVVKRCLDCVRLQTYPHWEHLICSDGAYEASIHHLSLRQCDQRVHYCHTAGHAGDYGNVVRRHLLGLCSGDYVVFFDDDNLIFPGYLQAMLTALECEPEAGFAVCQIVHFGPLNEAKAGRAPQVLKCDPIGMQLTDTLQIMWRRDVIQRIGWQSQAGYCADGATIEAAKAAGIKHAQVPLTLGFHI